MNNKLWALLCTVWLISSTLFCASARSETANRPSIVYLSVATSPSGELAATILYPLLDFLSVTGITVDDKPTSIELSANQLIIERWLNEHFRFTADNHQVCSMQVDPTRLRSTAMANIMHIEIGTTLDCQVQHQLRISYLASVVNLPEHQLIFTAVEHGKPLTRLFNRKQESFVWTIVGGNNQHASSNHVDPDHPQKSHGSAGSNAIATNDQSTLATPNRSQHRAGGSHSTDHSMEHSTNQTASEHTVNNHVGGSPISGRTVFIVCTVLFFGGLFTTWRVIRHM